MHPGHGVEALEHCHGKRLVRLSHRADLTPVCTAACTAFANPYGILRTIGTEPPGHSIPDFLRLVPALQASDEPEIASPEG